MKYEVTQRGVYDAKGEMIEIGAEVEAKGDKMPGYLIGKAVPVRGGKTFITNPDGALKAEHHGGGKFNITQGETVLLSGITKADADDFNALSNDDKAAFVAAQTKPAE